MLPLVGDLAPAHRRASSLSLVVSGLALGLLVARVLSGVVANYTAWRNIYWLALGAQYLTFTLRKSFLGVKVPPLLSVNGQRDAEARPLAPFIYTR